MQHQSMTCAEAALTIDEYRRKGIQEFNDQRLLAHLTDCPECFAVAAKAFDAKQILSQVFEETRTQQQSATYESTPLQYVRTRVEARGADTSGARQPIGTSIMSTIFNQLKKRSRLSLGVGFAALGLLAATLIPFTYEDTIGYEVAFAGVNKDLALDSDKISELLAELGVEGARVYVTGCEATCNLKISDLKSREDGKLLIAAFESGGAVQLTNDVTPIVDTTEGNLFTKASHLVFVSDDFDNSEFSTDDLNNIIIERLGQNYEMKIESCFGTMTGDSLGVSFQSLAGDSDRVWVMDSVTGEAGMIFMGVFSGDDLEKFDVGNGQLTDKQIARLKEHGYTVSYISDGEGGQQVLLHRSSDSLTIGLGMLDEDGNHMWLVDSASGDSVMVFSGTISGDDPLNLRQLIANSGETTLGGLIKKSVYLKADDSACVANWNMGDLAGFDFSSEEITGDQIAKLEARGYTVTVTQTEDGKQQITLRRTSQSGADDGPATVDEEVIKIVTDGDALGKGTPGEDPADPAALPEGFELSQNYPNPFNPTTKIDYAVASPVRVRIDIINVMGQTVRTLVDEEVGAGAHTVEWDATDGNGRQVASGMYFYRFKAGNIVQTRKMTLLK